MAEDLGGSFDRGRATADAAGVATVSFGPPRLGIRWKVTRIHVDSTSVLESEVTVYTGGMIDAANAEDHTYSGNDDTADETQPIVVENQPLLVRWTGCTPGAVCTARINYEREGR